jgi:phospholipid transport system substrate-binding protein
MRNAMHLRILFGILLAAYCQLVSADSPGVTAARQTVDKLNTALLDVMKNADRLGYQGRLKRLDPVVRDVFQFEAVAQIALGSHWKKLDQPEKLAFMAKLTDLSVATYAAQFNAYGGEKFQYESSDEIKADRITLRYVMVVPNDKPIKFEYIVNHFNGRWVIINIIVDGISDLALKKAQYTSVIDREGFEKLLEKLQQKTTDYAKNNK